MGITGLIPFLEKASTQMNIRDIKGYTVAIDTYCWLHKGAFSCAEKLVRGEDTNIHIQYCIKYVNLLLSHNIKPILVFDGQHLPAKALTEKRRREARQNSKKRAAELLRLGKTEEAKSHMRRSVDITHEMALQLIQECRKRNVDCIVAPYEADAQLAFLNKTKIAQYIITEDSDLVLFGCEKVIFKLDLTGNCLLVDADKLYLAMGCRIEKFTFDKFRYMCILSGCDYLDSLPGIGLAKACKFILKVEETDMTKILKKLPQCLNLRNLIVTDDYVHNFLKAEATFKHMYVYNPLLRQMVRLNDIPEDIENYEIYCTNAGEILDNDIAFQLALGNLNPFSFKQLDNWHPDQVELNNKIKTNSWTQSTKTKHKSIWKPSFETHLPHKAENKIDAFLFKKIKFKIDEPQAVEEQGNSCESEMSVVALYTDNDAEPPNKRQCLSNKSSDEDDEKTTILDSKKHNPFAKSTLKEYLVSPTHITTENNSLLKTLSPKKNSSIQNSDSTKLSKLSKFNRTVMHNKKEVKSRFFFSTATLVKKSIEANDSEKEDYGKIVADIETICDENNEKITAFYSPTKTMGNCETQNPETNENDKNISSDFSENDSIDMIITSSQKENNEKLENLYNNNHTDKNKEIIEISDTEVKSKPIVEKTRKNIRGIGLKRNSKKKFEDPKIQGRLMEFGFKKKPSIQSK